MAEVKKRRLRRREFSLSGFKESIDNTVIIRGHDDDPGPQGPMGYIEPGSTRCSGAYARNKQRPARKSYTKEDWEELGILGGLTQDKKEVLCNNLTTLYEYLDNNNVKRTVYDFDIYQYLLVVLKLVVVKSDSLLEEPDKFYEYCIDYVKSIYPHYENIKKATESTEHPSPCIDIEPRICSDLAENLISILNKD